MTLATAVPPQAAPEGDGIVSHRTAASRRGWTFWRTFECRTAGFASSRVLSLAAPDCARIAVALLEAERTYERAWDAAEAHCRGLVRDAVRRSGDAAPPVDPERLAAWRRALRRTQARQLCVQVLEEIPPALGDAVSRAASQLEEARGHYREAYADAAAALTRRLLDDVGDSSVRSALAWQNRGLLPNLAEWLTRRSGADRRRVEELIAFYLQRYCVKNDTIGFFGPVGWGEFQDHLGAPVVLRGDPDRLRDRTVYFEDWALQALADTLSSDPRLLPWSAPARAPFARLEGPGHLVLPGGARAALSPEERALLVACDGRTPACHVAAALLAQPFLAFEDEAAVYEELRRLSALNWLHWGFRIPLSDSRPERALRAQLLRVAPAALREEALQRLDRLEAARDAVPRRSDAPDALVAALQQLDAVFEELTGADATRNAGQTYGARTIVYEDCEREARVWAGPALLEALTPALDPILDSARWFCHGAGQLFLQALTQAWEADGRDAVNLADLWLRVQPLFYGDGPPGMAALVDDLQARWCRLVDPCGAGSQDVAVDSEGLAALAAGLFESPPPPWRGGVHQSPDVMVAASSAEALMRGEGLFVLGELHAGINTLMCQSAFEQHPAPERLLQALRADLGQPRVMPLIHREGTGQPIRVQPVVDPDTDFELQFSRGIAPLHPLRALRSGDLVVRRRAGALVATTGDERFDLPLLEVFGGLVSSFVADKFHPFPARAGTTPRVTIDRLVIQRRQWQVSCDDLAFPAERADEALAFVAFRRWAAAQGLPRFLFVKAPWERKPFYLDIDSPCLVRALIRQSRRGAARGSTLRLSEMLPAHGQMWFPHGGAQTRSSEFRLVAARREDLGAAP